MAVSQIESVARDVRHMARGLRKSPGFTIAVVLTLALGIGGNTAIFSVVDQLLLRPLPYPDGDRLVMIYETGLRGDRSDASPANWLDWQRESRTLKTLAAWDTRSVTLTDAGEPTRLTAQVVSSEFFPLLGVAPALGRTLSAQDDQPNAPRVVVLSHQLWQRRFGGDPNVIGRVVRLNERPAEIVGVMAAGFRFVYQDNDLWTPFQLDRDQAWRETAGRFMNVVGRLDTGTTMAATRAEMQAIAGRLAAMHAFNKDTTVALVPLREELTGDVHTSLLMLYGAVGVLLSIACFNVANLLVARAASRRREIAIRASLGAGRAAVVRQLLVESLLLAIAGGVLGMALARWSLDALLAFAPANLLRVPELFIDRRVLLYALGLSAVTGVIVGMVPAFLVARQSMVASVRTGTSSVTRSPRLRQALVVCQVAMTVILLCGAGLLVRTVVALNTTDKGFDEKGLLTMEIALPPPRYPPERATAFFREAATVLRGLPAVESAVAADSLALIGSPLGGTGFHLRNTREVPAAEQSVAVRVVTPGYFRAFRIPVVRGREFTSADDANPTPGLVVNEAFARAFLTDGDHLGASLRVDMEVGENPYQPIIGVVGNVGEGSVRSAARPTVFYSHRQMPQNGMTLFVRTDRPAAIAPAAVDAIHRLDRNLAVTNVQTFEAALAESIARERLSALVSGVFASSGLLLASLGLYALLALIVTERTKEIGLRIALGAPLGRLKRSVVGGGLRLVAVGAAIGIGGSLLVLRSLRTLLFGVTPYDSSTYATVLALLCVVAGLASYIPARRAAHVQPLTALRQD